MPGYAPRIQCRIAFHQCCNNARERRILLVSVVLLVFTLEFDTNRIIIAGGDTAKLRFACMPCSPVERNELDHCTIATNQQMRAHPQAANPGKVGVCVPIEGIGKQLFNAGAAKFARRQTHAMHDDETGRIAARPEVLIG